MKSFVYTVVAATIAASSAVANSTDASTSGTVPAFDQPDHCEFYDVVDGEMAFTPGWNWDTMAGGAEAPHPGFWKTDRYNPAHMKVRTRGAAKISVMGGDVVINKNDGTEYPVKVDYSTPKNIAVPAELNDGADHLETTNLTYANGYVEALPGVQDGRFGMGAIYGQNYAESAYRHVFTSKDQPNWGDDNAIYAGSWSHYSPQSNPNVPEPQGQLVNVHSTKLVHDQFNVILRFNDFEGYDGTNANPMYNFSIFIQGLAWMLDSNGEMRYEDDGMGRRTEPTSAYPNGRMAMSYYGMTDGDYYIEHTVQCLQ